MILREYNNLPPDGHGFIYFLSHPITNEIRYVGQTRRSLNKRLRDHIGSIRIKEGKKKMLPVAAWANKLKKQGLRPVINLLETVSLSNLDNREIELIEQYKKNYNLLNIAKGGSRPSSRRGFKESKEFVAKYKLGVNNKMFVDKTGIRFHNMIVVRHVGFRTKISMWECKCDCGNTAVIGVNKIGVQKSCGCARRVKWSDEKRKALSERFKGREKLSDGSFRNKAA